MLMRDVLKSGTFWFSVVSMVAIGVVLGLSVEFWGALSELKHGEESLSTTIRNIMLILAAILALPLAIWRGWVAERQLSVSDKQLDVSQNDLQLSQQQLRLTDQQIRLAESSARQAEESSASQRYLTGLQMLGDRSLTVRMGGITALQDLANEFPEEYDIQVMRQLCQFARNPTADNNVDSVDESSEARLREDVQRILQVVGGRSERQIALEEAEPYSPNFIDADLRRGQFWSADFSNAIFLRANLEEANFGNVNLRNVVLEDANLSGVDFTGEFVVDRISQVPSYGLTQAQLDMACVKGGKSPNVVGMVDPITGEDLESIDREC